MKDNHTTIIRLNKGFTIIELVVALALFALLISVGIPSFTGLIRDNQLVTNTNSLVAALQLARSEAVRRGVEVKIIRTSPTASSNVWESGWEIFIDEDGDGVRDTNESVLRQQGALPSGFTLRSDNGYDDWVAYQPSGLVTGSSANTDTFTLCKQEDGDAYYREITIEPTGRPYTEIGDEVETCP